MQELSYSMGCHLPLGAAVSLVQSTLCPAAYFPAMGDIHLSNLPLSIFWERQAVSYIHVHSLTSLSNLLIYHLFRQDFPDPSIKIRPSAHSQISYSPSLSAILSHHSLITIWYTMFMFFVCVCLSLLVCKLHQSRYFSRLDCYCILGAPVTE